PVGEEIDGVISEHQVLHYRVDLLPRLHQRFSTCDAEMPVGFCLAPNPLNELVWSYLLPRVLPLRIYSKYSVTTANSSPIRQLTVTPTRAPQIATSESHEGGEDSSVGSFPRSEERRVGKECRSRWSREHENKKDTRVLKTRH